MQIIRRPLSFRNKLLAIFFLCSIVPLVLVAIFASQRVQSTYTSTLLSSFESTASDYQRLVNSFVESNKLWIRTLASQDLLLTEVESIIQSDSQSETLPQSKTLFASLTSVASENPFIERMYIADTSGHILISTSTNDIGKTIRLAPFLTVPMREGRQYIGAMFIGSNGKRLMPVSAPLIRKRDRSAIGVLVVELHGAVIHSLLAGSAATADAAAGDRDRSRRDFFLLDQGGYLLTKANGISETTPVRTAPFLSCQRGTVTSRGEWVGTLGETVFGVSRCIRVDDMIWTLSIERPVREAYAVGNQLALVILSITAAVSAVVSLLIYRFAQSLTRPIRLLSAGAKKFGAGNMTQRIEVHTNDELEVLAESFNDMAQRLDMMIDDLTGQRDRLEKQKKRLDVSASLLLRRDLELRSTNDELELEKEHIVAERNKLEIIMGGVKDAVIAVDTSRRIMLFNRSAELLLGKSRQDVLGKALDAIVRFTDGDHVLSAETYCPVRTDKYEGVVFTAESIRLEVVTSLASDVAVTKYVNLTVGQIREAASVDLGAILTMHDVTAERQLEEMKLDFVSMAAHELRTPLTAIIGYIELLRLDGIDRLTDQQKIFLERLSVSSQTLRTLIDNLLNVSRIEQGTFKVEVMPTDMISLIRDQVKSFENQAGAKHQTVTFIPPAGPVAKVMADPVRINQVLANLIANAVNYTPEGGMITLELKQEGSMLRVFVHDTGIGIPKDALPKLFTKFFRVTGVLEQGSKGNGLGLYITKSILKMHRGTISVESELGKGSTFMFSLPIASEEQVAGFGQRAKYAALRPEGMSGMIRPI